MDKPIKLCRSHKIINPLTNRCVLKTGAIGKKLILDLSLNKIDSIESVVWGN